MFNMRVRYKNDGFTGNERLEDFISTAAWSVGVLQIGEPQDRGICPVFPNSFNGVCV